MFVGTAAFEVIVKQQIKRLQEPSVKCCQLVYDELIRILGQLLAKIVSRLGLFDGQHLFIGYYPGCLPAISCSQGAFQLSRHQLPKKCNDANEQARYGPCLVRFSGPSRSTLVHVLPVCRPVM